MWGWRADRTTAVGLAAAIAAVCCLLPLAYLFVRSGSELLAGAGALLLDERQRGLLYTTALLGAGSALGASAIGVPLGVALARIALPLKSLQRIALAAPVLLPPYVVALGWIYLGGDQGIATVVLGSDYAGRLTSGLPAAVFVLSLVYYPIAMLATEAAMRRVDGRLEEAGLLVGPPWLVLRRVSLPLVAPSVIAAALVIFVLAVSDFSVPSLLRVRVYTTEVFTAFSALYNFSRAIVLALPLVVLATLVAIPAGFVAGGRLLATRRSVGAHPIRLDDWRRPAQGWAALVWTGALVLPVAMLIREASFTRDARTVVSGSGTAIVNSLLLAAAGATVVVAVAVWLGHRAARGSRHLLRAASVICLALFAVPSTVVGVSLIGFWNQPGWPGAIYGTNAMFVLAYLARFVPIAVLVTAGAAQQVPMSHEEAAAMSGASWWRTMRKVVLPQMRTGLIVAWVLIFILAFGELGVSILVTPPGETTLPIRIYTMIANAPSSHVALLALLQATVIFVPLGLLALAAPGRERK